MQVPKAGVHAQLPAALAGRDAGKHRVHRLQDLAIDLTEVADGHGFRHAVALHVLRADGRLPRSDLYLFIFHTFQGFSHRLKPRIET